MAKCERTRFVQKLPSYPGTYRPASLPTYVKGFIVFYRIYIAYIYMVVAFYEKLETKLFYLRCDILANCNTTFRYLGEFFFSSPTFLFFTQSKLITRESLNENDYCDFFFSLSFNSLKNFKYVASSASCHFVASKFSSVIFQRRITRLNEMPFVNKCLKFFTSRIFNCGDEITRTSTITA